MDKGRLRPCQYIPLWCSNPCTHSSEFLSRKECDVIQLKVQWAPFVINWTSYAVIVCCNQTSKTHGYNHIYHACMQYEARFPSKNYVYCTVLYCTTQFWVSSWQWSYRGYDVYMEHNETYLFNFCICGIQTTEQKLSPWQRCQIDNAVHPQHNFILLHLLLSSLVTADINQKSKYHIQVS